MLIRKNIINRLVAIIAGMFFILNLSAQTDETVIVTVDNFVLAEVAKQFDSYMKLIGGVNTFFHFREAVPLDKQTVIRMNRDVLYSSAIVDVSKGATITIPETDGRYLSIMIMNENGYINKVYQGKGTYELTMKEFDTHYVSVALRTLIDPVDPADIGKVKAIQNGVTIKSNSAIPYNHPKYDKDSYKAIYEAVIGLSRFVPDTKGMFGKKEEVTEVRHLLGTAFGFGGLPEQEAFYLNVEPNLPVGAYEITVKDVPVDAFWSISLYNKEGYFQENEYNANSVNNITATPNEDGSYTIHFGSDPKSPNYLYIMEGWNYAVRMYQPRKEILEGRWVFPDVKRSGEKKN
jgi:hypothetical protein